MSNFTKSAINISLQYMTVIYQMMNAAFRLWKTLDKCTLLEQIAAPLASFIYNLTLQFRFHCEFVAKGEGEEKDADKRANNELSSA